MYTRTSENEKNENKERQGHEPASEENGNKKKHSDTWS